MTPARVVSVTPAAVERDSRTYKHAASLARFGYASVVVEGQASRPAGDPLPFDLISVTGPAAGPASEGGSSGAVAQHAARLRRSRLGRVARRVFDLPMVLLGHLRWNLRTYRALPPAELYYLHSYNQFIGTFLAARRHGARFVYDAHDFYFEEDSGPQASAGRLASGRLLEAIERSCVKRAAEMTTVSAGVADLFERRFSRRPEVVRNCPDLRLDRPAASDVRAAIEAPQAAFLLVCTGNAKLGDTIDEALAAMISLPDSVHLAFVGAGYERHIELARARELLGRVHFLPPVPPTEVTSFISTADAAPILYQAFTVNFLNALPNRFFHAIAAGLPILCPPLVEMRALSDRYELGVDIDPTVPSSIANGIRKLADDPELLARLGSNVIRAREDLNWEHEERVIARMAADSLAAGETGG